MECVFLTLFTYTLTGLFANNVFSFYVQPHRWQHLLRRGDSIRPPNRPVRCDINHSQYANPSQFRPSLGINTWRLVSTGRCPNYIKYVFLSIFPGLLTLFTIHLVYNPGLFMLLSIYGITCFSFMVHLTLYTYDMTPLRCT
jgi:hypothetical protein